MKFANFLSLNKYVNVRYSSEYATSVAPPPIIATISGEELLTAPNTIKFAGNGNCAVAMHIRKKYPTSPNVCSEFEIIRWLIQYQYSAKIKMTGRVFRRDLKLKFIFFTREYKERVDFKQDLCGYEI